MAGFNATILPVAIPPSNRRQKRHDEDDYRCRSVRRGQSTADPETPIQCVHVGCRYPETISYYCEWYDRLNNRHQTIVDDPCSADERCLAIGDGPTAEAWCEPMHYVLEWEIGDAAGKGDRSYTHIMQASRSDVHTKMATAVDMYWDAVNGKAKTMSSTNFLTINDMVSRGSVFDTRRAESNAFNVRDNPAVMISVTPGVAGRTKVISFFHGISS